MAYEPGDHVGIFPANRAEIVDGIIKRLTGVTDPDETLQLQVLKEKQTQNGNSREDTHSLDELCCGA